MRLITEEDATETEESCKNSRRSAYYVKLNWVMLAPLANKVLGGSHEIDSG